MTDEWIGRRSRPDEPTAREREVLHCLWEGLTNHEISVRLKIAQKTVEAHRANLMQKFRAGNIAQLLRASLREGILQVEFPRKGSRPFSPPPSSTTRTDAQERENQPPSLCPDNTPRQPS